MSSTTLQPATVRREGVEVASVDGDEEIKRASRQAFTAYELSMRRGHHPQLWHAVKGSVFQALYEMNVANAANCAP